MSLLGWKEACEDMTPEERHYYEKQSGPTKPNPIIKYLPDEKFKKAMKEVLETMPIFPSYERSGQQSATLAEELENFLRDFPSQRLGQTLATIVPTHLELFNVYDEEVIRRLRLFRSFIEKDNGTDWVGYLEAHMEDAIPKRGK